MTARIFLTNAYDDALTKIEDFIYSNVENILLLEDFWEAHDVALRFVSENPRTPAIHPKTGDQSWPFGDGRYRLFFKHIEEKDVVYMTHLIDNRQANLEFYPGNSMPTYDEEK